MNFILTLYKGILQYLKRTKNVGKENVGVPKAPLISLCIDFVLILHHFSIKAPGQIAEYRKTPHGKENRCCGFCSRD